MTEPQWSAEGDPDVVYSVAGDGASDRENVLLAAACRHLNSGVPRRTRRRGGSSAGARPTRR